MYRIRNKNTWVANMARIEVVSIKPSWGALCSYKTLEKVTHLRSPSRFSAVGRLFGGDNTYFIDTEIDTETVCVDTCRGSNHHIQSERTYVHVSYYEIRVVKRNDL